MPKLERKGGEEDPGVNNGWIDGGTKCKVGDASRATGGVRSDGTSYGGASMVAKADGDKNIDKEESGPSVIRATRDVTEGGNKLGGTKKERVFDKQIGQKVETTGLEVGSSVNRRGRGHKQIDRIRGTAEG